MKELFDFDIEILFLMVVKIWIYKHHCKKVFLNDRLDEGKLVTKVDL